jgi:hypothetical protein
VRATISTRTPLEDHVYEGVRKFFLNDGMVELVMEDRNVKFAIADISWAVVIKSDGSTTVDSPPDQVL